jgi:hypothetical protein
MKDKIAQTRQAVIQQILGNYGELDHIDVICLGARFKTGVEVIIEDVQKASKALEQQKLAQERAARLDQERATELRLAREILKRGGV